jgi:outer membrane protein OmpA-like peptidoglycan-associated protein
MSVRTRRFLSIGVFAALFLAASWASAQDGNRFAVEQFEPMHAQGTNVLNLGKSEVLNAWTPSFGVFVHYVDDPLVLAEQGGGDEVGSLVGSQLKTEVWAAMGFFDFADLGVVMPLIATQSGEDVGTLEGVEGFAAGDLRLIPKFRLLEPGTLGGLGLGFLTTVWIPTGDADTYNSDGAVRVEPRLIVDYTINDFVFLINGGFQVRETLNQRNFTSGNSIRWGAGIESPTGVDNLKAIGTIFGAVGLEDARDEGSLLADAASNQTPVEAELGLQYALPANLVANIGGGLGLSESVGSPDFRVFASLGYTPRKSDSDGDGLMDDEDECPEKPEDKDGFEDADGCPDEDNDDDGILDKDDACPDKAEDMDEFDDADGCPDPDNDDDTVLDVDDKCPDTPGIPEENGCPLGDKDGDGLIEDDQCPEEPEDKDGFQDEDGCPDPDNDQDGIEDAEDNCPDDPEDKDGFQDEDGCPDTDNDQDGIVDANDQCPDEPETINGNKDEDGCPDKGKTKVKVTEEKIEILERVYFDTNKATIKQRSFNVLDQVATVLKRNPQITKVRVEGHTDSRGSAEYNLELSKRRAQAVKEYLVDAGIGADRLVSEGYGETQPIETNTTAQGRERNRRVEFRILEVDGEPRGQTPSQESQDP